MPAFETPGPVTAGIDVVAGDVRIAASGGGAVLVDVDPADPADAADVEVARLTRVEFGDGRLLVRSPRPRSWIGRSRGAAIRVRIELPAGSRVQADGQITDFDCAGRLGDCRITTGIGQIRVDRVGAATLKVGLGDVAVEHAAGRLELTAGSGDVRVRDLAAGAVIKCSNGDTWVGEAVGEIRVKAANGDIAVDVAQDRVTAQTANGDIRLGAVAHDAVVLETRRGDLEVGIPEGTAAWLDVRARAGRVRNALEPSAAPAAADRAVEVRAHTGAGDVLIRRP